MTAPTVASLARQVAELRGEVDRLHARLAREDRIDEIMSTAHLPAPPPAKARVATRASRRLWAVP